MIPPIPTDEDLRALFPERRDAPPDGVFELGLVLGGTVSSGAYTAGVLDYLVQALDALDSAQAIGDTAAPKTRVVIKVVGGASGGGVNAAILSRLIPYSFPAVERPNPSPNTGNPFFDIWVNRLDILGMLSCDDLKDEDGLTSVLNSSPIERSAESLIRFVSNPYGIGHPQPYRQWVDSTLTMFLTLTNLRGIPYKVDFNGGAVQDPKLSQSFVNHGDYVRFDFDTRPGNVAPVRKDSFGVSLWRDGEGLVDWGTVAKFSIATGAFPIGFKTRDLSRPLSHYAYRTVIVPGVGNVSPTEQKWLTPSWDDLRGPEGELPDLYDFPSVDGGATNNAPIELVRTSLAGMIAKNPRKGIEANRAVLLIDPFANGATLGPASVSNVESVLVPFVLGMVGESRYETADLILAADETIFSRFMITARRGEHVGTEALATGGLGAFQGFLSRAFREHDYLLGRRNAHEFLKNQFVLPETNPFFKSWTKPQVDGNAVDGPLDSDGNRFIRILPLLGKAAFPTDLPIWPVGALDPERTLRTPIKERVEAVLSVVENHDISSNLFIHAYLWPAIAVLRSGITDRIMTAIQKSLKDSHLLG